MSHCRHWINMTPVLISAVVVFDASSAKADLTDMFMEGGQFVPAAIFYAGFPMTEMEGHQLRSDFDKVEVYLIDSFVGTVSFLRGGSVVCTGTYNGDHGATATNDRPSSLYGRYVARPGDTDCPESGDISLTGSSPTNRHFGAGNVVEDVDLILYGADGFANVASALRFVEKTKGDKFDPSAPCKQAFWTGPFVWLPEVMKCDPIRVLGFLDAGWTIPFGLQGADVQFSDGVFSAGIADTWVHTDTRYVVECIFDGLEPADLPKDMSWVNAKLIEAKDDGISLSCEPASEP